MSFWDAECPNCPEMEIFEKIINKTFMYLLTHFIAQIFLKKS